MTELSLRRHRAPVSDLTHELNVILRCAPLRASKDDRKACAEHHPSRRAEVGSHLRMTARLGRNIVIAGHSRLKDGVASRAYASAIHAL
jgi:hypothetical protein